MYKTILVEKSIEDGEKLIRKLEEKSFPVAAAFWRYLDEAERYRLVVVSPVVSQEGPLRTYRPSIRLWTNSATPYTSA